MNELLSPQPMRKSDMEREVKIEREIENYRMEDGKRETERWRDREMERRRDGETERWRDGETDLINRCERAKER
jgi:hypothetical protein